MTDPASDPQPSAESDHEGPPKVNDGEAHRWLADGSRDLWFAVTLDGTLWSHWGASWQRFGGPPDEGRKRLAAALVEAREGCVSGVQLLAGKERELARARERIAALEGEAERARGLLSRGVTAFCHQTHFAVSGEHGDPARGCGECAPCEVAAYLATQPAKEGE